MKIKDAVTKLKEVEGIKFGSLVKDIPDLKINKGNTGKLLEKLIGLPPSINLRDFEDGELKTNKADNNAKPLETMFITQLHSEFDNIIGSQSFTQSHVYRKIQRGAYVPVCKIGEVSEWYFHPCIEWDLVKEKEIFSTLENDYYTIRTKIINDIEKGDGNIHTSSGDYMQIRTKDSKPYHPIYSKTYKKNISNKNFAFYFKPGFMKYLQKKNKYTPITRAKQPLNLPVYIIQYRGRGNKLHPWSYLGRSLITRSPEVK